MSCQRFGFVRLFLVHVTCLAVPFVVVADDAGRPTTFCNPLPLPGVPDSHLADLHRGGLRHRQVADPALLRQDGKWYLYASSGFLWVSADDGGSWRKAANPSNFCGHAPAIVRHRGRFLYIAGMEPRLFASDSPEGPFEELGFLKIDRNGAPPTHDPDLFSDDDGRLYFYWGCTARDGIWGCELDANDPTRALTKPKRLFAFDPVNQPWERSATKPSVGWIEGAWMVKIGGRYFLTYCAAGTESPGYAMGAYVADSPLGAFRPQRQNPFFRTTAGPVTGTGHGAVVQDERGEWWVASCVLVGARHRYERLVALDRLTLTSDGELANGSATSEPQWLPQYGKGATGWKAIGGISTEPEATDLSFRTAAPPRPLPHEIGFTFEQSVRLRAVRILWRENGYDPAKGVVAGPYRYRIDCRRRGGVWQTLIDASTNDRDLLADYRETVPLVADEAKLTVLGAPAGICPSVAEWTLFGEIGSADLDGLLATGEN